MQRLRIAKGLVSPKNRPGPIGEKLELREKLLPRTDLRCMAAQGMEKTWKMRAKHGTRHMIPPWQARMVVAFLIPESLHVY